jgi:hypothetical protein
MSKSIYGFLIFLVSCLAYAEEGSAADVPTPTVDPIFVALFGVVFFGGIAYFGWLVWRNEQKRKSEEGNV